MALQFPQGFIIQNSDPSDSRFTVADAAGRRAIANGYLGLVVFQQDTKKLWTLVDVSKASDSDDSGWHEVADNGNNNYDLGTHDVEELKNVSKSGTAFTIGDSTDTITNKAATNIGTAAGTTLSWAEGNNTDEIPLAKIPSIPASKLPADLFETHTTTHSSLQSLREDTGITFHDGEFFIFTSGTLDGNIYIYTGPNNTQGGPSADITDSDFTLVNTDYTLQKASNTTLGGVKLVDNAVQTVAANSRTTTANRTYAVQLNSNDQAVVNVPWEDTDTNLAVGSNLDNVITINSGNLELNTPPSEKALLGWDYSSDPDVVSDSAFFSQEDVREFIGFVSNDGVYANAVGLVNGDSQYFVGTKSFGNEIKAIGGIRIDELSGKDNQLIFEDDETGRTSSASHLGIIEFSGTNGTATDFLDISVGVDKFEATDAQNSSYITFSTRDGSLDNIPDAPQEVVRMDSRRLGLSVPLGLNTYTTDPTDTSIFKDGDVIYNSTSNIVKVFDSGSFHSVGGSGHATEIGSNLTDVLVISGDTISLNTNPGGSPLTKNAIIGYQHSGESGAEFFSPSEVRDVVADGVTTGTIVSGGYLGLDISGDIVKGDADTWDGGDVNGATTFKQVTKFEGNVIIDQAGSNTNQLIFEDDSANKIGVARNVGILSFEGTPGVQPKFFGIDVGIKKFLATDPENSSYVTFNARNGSLSDIPDDPVEVARIDSRRMDLSVALGLNVYTADPAANISEDGDLIYNSTDDAVKVFDNDAWHAVGGGGHLNVDEYIAVDTDISGGYTKPSSSDGGAVAIGDSASATGLRAMALGSNTLARAKDAVAIGPYAVAGGVDDDNLVVNEIRLGHSSAPVTIHPDNPMQGTNALVTKEYVNNAINNNNGVVNSQNPNELIGTEHENLTIKFNLPGSTGGKTISFKSPSSDVVPGSKDVVADVFGVFPMTASDYSIEDSEGNAVTLSDYFDTVSYTPSGYSQSTVLLQYKGAKTASFYLSSEQIEYETNFSIEATTDSDNYFSADVKAWIAVKDGNLDNNDKLPTADEYTNPLDHGFNHRYETTNSHDHSEFGNNFGTRLVNHGSHQRLTSDSHSIWEEGHSNLQKTLNPGDYIWVTVNGLAESVWKAASDDIDVKFFSSEAGETGFGAQADGSTGDGARLLISNADGTEGDLIYTNSKGVSTTLIDDSASGSPKFLLDSIVSGSANQILATNSDGDGLHWIDPAETPEQWNGGNVTGETDFQNTVTFSHQVNFEYYIPTDTEAKVSGFDFTKMAQYNLDVRRLSCIHTKYDYYSTSNGNGRSGYLEGALAYEACDIVIGQGSDSEDKKLVTMYYYLPDRTEGGVNYGSEIWKYHFITTRTFVSGGHIPAWGGASNTTGAVRAGGRVTAYNGDDAQKPRTEGTVPANLWLPYDIDSNIVGESSEGLYAIERTQFVYEGTNVTNHSIIPPNWILN